MAQSIYGLLTCKGISRWEIWSGSQIAQLSREKMRESASQEERKENCSLCAQRWLFEFPQWKRWSHGRWTRKEGTRRRRYSRNQAYNQLLLVYYIIIIRFKVVSVKGISLKALYLGKAEKKWLISFELILKATSI